MKNKRKYSLNEIKEKQKNSGFYCKISNNMGSLIILYIQKLNFSPNYFTFLSLLFGLSIIYFILNEYFIFAAVIVNISYLFDNLDGQWARLKNKTSKFGEILDGTVDHILEYILLISLFFYFLEKGNHLLISIIIITIAIHGIYVNLNRKVTCLEENKKYNEIKSNNLKKGKLKLFFRYIAPILNYSNEKFILTILFITGNINFIVYYFFAYTSYTALMVFGKYYIDLKDK